MTSEDQANRAIQNDTPAPSANGVAVPAPPQDEKGDDQIPAPPQVALPRFRSHKVVQAARINEVRRRPADSVVGGLLVLLVPGPDGITGTVEVGVSVDYMRKHDPAPGGYLVRYEDGYESYSPADAFEGGYHAVKEADPDPAARRDITRHRVGEANGNRELVIEVLDDPGAGGACHLYKVTGFDTSSNPSCPFVARYGEPAKHSTVLFQNGPIDEVGGANGVTHEALLAIIEDRLTMFQEGRFVCEENRNALIHVQHALGWLKKRTERRRAAGTEGTHEGN